MKEKIVKLINKLLAPLNAQFVVGRNRAFINMDDALRRLSERNIKINTILDIGAAKGSWSLMALEYFSETSVIAIEPLEEQIVALSKIKQKNHFFDFVTCVAGARDGDKVTLNVSEDLDGSTVDGIGGKARLVVSRSIDSIVAEKHVSGPFLIKFDTHGFEAPIIDGAMNTLKQASVVIMEVYNFNITEHALRFHETCALMEKIGFRCFDMADPMLRIFDKSFWQMDLFFARADSKIFAYNSFK